MLESNVLIWVNWIIYDDFDDDIDFDESSYFE